MVSVLTLSLKNDTIMVNWKVIFRFFEKTFRAERAKTVFGFYDLFRVFIIVTILEAIYSLSLDIGR